MFTASNLFAQLLFGAIGAAAFLYGKKTSALKPMLIGIALMGFPYFLSETWMLYLIGGGLTALLFVSFPT